MLDKTYQDVPRENFSRGLLEVSIPELGNPIRGKVRDNWVVKRNDSLTRVMVTTDRQWTYVRPVCTIPGKGQIANLISAYWFEKTKDIVANHVISVPHQNVLIARQAVATLPVEVVVRRYLAKGTTPTSLSHNYFERGRREIYGIHFPDNLKLNQELPMGNILTPTTKAQDGHDQELTEDEASSLVRNLFGGGVWEKVRTAALSVFERARIEYLNKGIILADTKFEFGIDEWGKLMLIDELLTPECSRLWVKDTFDNRFEKGLDPEPNKNILAHWLASHGFTGKGEVPIIDNQIIDELSEVYAFPYRRILGNDLSKENLHHIEARKSILNYLSATH